MKRRDFVTSVFAAGLAAPALGNPPTGGDTQQGVDHGHGLGPRDERAENHVVSFGFWLPTPDYPADPAELDTANPQPIDRFAPNDPSPRRLNGHFLTPQTSRIRVGDTVSFIISGFHLPLIYGPGVEPADVDRTNLIVTPGMPPPFPPLINDPDERLYRGLDPRTLVPTQDRVEVVGFNTPGRYLVICGVLPHFFEAATSSFVMFGYIDVHQEG